MSLLEPWSENSLRLLYELNGDPLMMSHLGGPETSAKIEQRHSNYVAASPDEPQMQIADPADGRAVGWIGYWNRTWRDNDVCEIGWSVLPRVQGRRLAGAAVREILRYAATHAKRDFVHAFPAIDNVPSSAICHRGGFTLMDAVDFEYPPGTSIRVNDWKIDLRALPTSSS